MARPWVADERDGLQHWRLAANTLNEQPLTKSRDVPPAWGLGMGLPTLDLKKQTCYENVTRASDIDGFFGKMTYAKEYGHEISNVENKEFV
jgi:hypothetical protein